MSAKKANYPAFIITQSSKNNKYYWRFIASNGRTLLRSTIGYKTKQNAKKSIQNVMRYGLNPKHYVIKTANIDNGGYFYILYGRKLGEMVYGQYPTANKIAISGNGKYYQSDNVFTSWQSVNRGIMSTIANLQVCAKKAKNSNKPYIVDMVKDRRKK